MSSSALTSRLTNSDILVASSNLLGLRSVQAMRSAGLDAIILDCQHGPYDEGDAASILREFPGTDVAFVTRVSRNDPALIGRLLDAGADAIVVPLIDSAADAESAVSACHYPPSGTRSFGPNRGDLGRDLRSLQARVDCFPMIETAAAINSLDAIASVRGIAGLVVGPIDLAISLGFEPEDAIACKPEAVEPMRGVVNVCERRGIIPGVFGLGEEHAAAMVTLGFRLVSVGSDINAITAAEAEWVKSLRYRGKAQNQEPEPPSGPGYH